MRLDRYSRKKPIDGWSSELVSQLILEMKQAKEPLSLRSLQINRRPTPDRLLTKVTGKPTSRKQLHQMACHYFGTWNFALEACDLRPFKTSHNGFWSQSLIIECLQILHRNGHPLCVKNIWRDHSRSTTQLLMKRTGRWTTGAGFYNAAVRFFDSWDKALARSGIDVDGIKEKPFWTKRKMIAAIQSIHEARIPLNAMFMQRDTSQQTAQVIKSRIGKARTGRSLIGAAYRTFGSWDCALKESGLNPKNFRIRRFRWDRQSIAKVIRALYKSKVLLNVGDLSKNSDEVTRSIIHRTIGRRIQGRRIFIVGRQQHKSWDDLLKYSGLKPGLIRKKSALCVQDKEQIIELIQTLYFNGHPLNPTAVKKNTRLIQRFIEEKFGRPVGGYSILRVAKHLFGSWDKALWDSGLNPNEIRLKSPANTTHLPVVLYQVEDVKINGERWKEKRLGAPPKSPQEILEERDAATTLKGAFEEMTEDDQELTEQIFDAILQIHHYKDQRQLIQYVSRYLGGKISEHKIGSVLSELAAKIRKN